MREALQNNKTVARKRFEGLVRRFKCDHELFCEYKDVIDDYVREEVQSNILIHFGDLLNSSIYVDDLICGQDDIRTLVPWSACKYSVTQACYCANGEVIRNNLICYGSEKVSKTESSETSAIDLRPPTKVLGLAWDPENDLIYFDPKDLLKFMSRRGENRKIYSKCGWSHLRPHWNSWPIRYQTEMSTSGTLDSRSRMGL
ncbi:DUF1758 domain-containing protein [Trichonephila clavipes]|nr:DUF1758 domain-containing protein [Trichonephila clavipes]